jgi:hypothetical protein
VPVEIKMKAVKKVGDNTRPYPKQFIRRRHEKEEEE